MTAKIFIQFAALVCVLSVGLQSVGIAQSDDYVLGQGLNVGAFNIAGYSTIEATARSHQNSGLNIDDLSLFVRGTINKAMNPFLEAEMAEAALWKEGRAPLKKVKPRLVIERLYNDFLIGEHVTLRTGKMLTPVGDWNLIHAGPLVRTTTRPLTTHRNFPEFATGVAAIADGVGPHQLRFEAYWQPAGDLDGPSPATVNYLFRNTAGLHVEWPVGLTDKFGFSLQRADVKASGEHQFLVGINGRLTLGALEFETEVTTTFLKNPLPTRRHKTEYGGYLQGAFKIDEQWAIVGRGELFRDRAFDETSRNFLIGLNYRPREPIVWKLEYVKQSGPNLGVSGGLSASFNVLF